MPGKIKVKVLAGRNLPVMDRSSDTTDAYVELKFGNTTYKTDVCRKSLNPQWNSEWYRFEVDDAELQDEPLQIRLMDHDTYSANDAIGKVYINLNPLLLPGMPPPVKNIWTLEATMNTSGGSQGGSVLTGWIPVYDTMHGIRGEVNIIVKVELFSDFNKFRESSCGVQFFYSPNIPYGYHAQVIHGFVEELVVSDDPEYKWIDKIRTPRASNEARQTLFFKLSGEVQRKIGLKALDLGGNAVIGYLQNFDLEGESGIVARGIGTAVTLVKIHDNVSLPPDATTVEEFALGLYSPSKQQFESLETDDSVPLLPHSPNHVVLAHTPSIHGTRVGNKFPGYGKPAPKRSATIVKVSRYEPIKPHEERRFRHRQMSLENSMLTSALKKTGISTLSLSDDALIDEASLRSMLALEDMRGESTSRFTRGLRNLRQLPQSVLALKANSVKSKLSDSCDEESDLDSTYSSAWSVGGSDSARSSIVSLGQIKRKKFTHKKVAGEGMASLLIRSIHSSVPLDSVREDRETPTPSPVKFLNDSADGNERTGNKEDTDDCSSSNEEYVSKEKLLQYSNEAICNKATEVEVTECKDDMTIPMISSSETDTSTSDDEQSESSATYNLLEDSESLVDPGSPTIKTPRPVDLSGRPLASSPGGRPVHRRLHKSKDNNSSHYKKRVTKTDKGSSTDPTSSDMDVEILSQGKSSPVYSKLHVTIPREKSVSDISSTGTEEKDKPADFTDTKEERILPAEKLEKEIAEVSGVIIEEVESYNEQKPVVEFADIPPIAMSTPVESYPNCEFIFDQVVRRESPPMPPDLSSSDKKLLLAEKKDVERLAEKKDFEKLSYSDDKDCEGIPVPHKKEFPSVPFPEGKNIEHMQSSHKKDLQIVPLVDKNDRQIMQSSHKKDLQILPYPVKKDFEKLKFPDETNPTNVPFPQQNDFYTLQVPERKDFENMAFFDERDFENLSLSDDEEFVEFSKDALKNCEESRTQRKAKDKESKKVQRTDTVIYKGPIKQKEKSYLPRDDSKDVIISTQSLPSLTPIPIIINPPDETSESAIPDPANEDDDSNRTDVAKKNVALVPKLLPKSASFGNITTETDTGRAFRQHSMLELIRIIDTKLLVHSHHARSDSIRSRKKRHERQSKQQRLTPSPEVAHRSHGHRVPRVPERSPHVHHRSHQSSVERVAVGSDCSSSTTTTRLAASSCSKVNSRSCHSSLESLQNAARTLTGESSRDNVVGCVVVDIELTTFPTSSSTSIAANNASSPSLEPPTTSAPIHECSNACNSRKIADDVGATKITNAANLTDNTCVPRPCPVLRQQDETSPSPSYPLAAVPTSVAVKTTQSPATKIHSHHLPLHRRSSDSDLSITPKGNSLAGSDRSVGGFFKTSTAVVRTMNQDALEMLEYPFITMQQYPPGFLVHIGGLVSSRSVKLLERISNLEEPEGRDAWWTEIRMEVRSHARALACNVVVGYKEETSIWYVNYIRNNFLDDVCVLNASGTAAVINLHHAGQEQDSVFISRLQPAVTGPTSAEPEREKSQKSIAIKSEKSETETPTVAGHHPSSGKVKRTSESNDHEMPYSPAQSGCHLCHLPYSEPSVPFRVNVSKCAICKRAKVPDVMFTTIELPESLSVTGRGGFIQATVCKSKRDLRGELHAKEISDCLPFLEYELHSLLLNKLKVKGMNAIFGLRVQVSVGERLVVGMAVGTAVFLTALPPPSAPQIASGNAWHNEEQLAEIQKALVEAAKKNREYYKLKPVAEIENGRVTTSDTDESDEDLPELDLNLGTRDTCVLEVDDVEDLDRISLLMDDKAPDDFHVVNTQSIPGLEDLEIVRNLQMFTQVSRAKIPTGQSGSMPSKYLARLLQTVYFKLRRMVPCALCDMQFKVALPEQDEVQIFVVGMALGLGDPVKLNKSKRKAVTHSASKDPVKKTDDNDMIFSLDEDHVENVTPDKITNSSTNERGALCTLQKTKPRSPLWPKRHMVHRHKHMPLKERYGVDITPLSYLPGGRIERYLGNLNFFFIRESTSIRENGGLSGFTHSFVMEVLAIVRAHITALGGNAMVAFFMTQCVLLHSPHKNQGQCLINVGGDVVSVSYFANEKHGGQSNC